MKVPDFDHIQEPAARELLNFFRNMLLSLQKTQEELLAALKQQQERNIELEKLLFGQNNEKNRNPKSEIGKSKKKTKEQKKTNQKQTTLYKKSLTFLFPDLAAQWHPTKNGNLTPETYIAGSGKKVWWKCPKANDHVWQASGSSRVRGAGCPACTGKQVSITNSLASLFPDLAAQWHPTKNGNLTPETYIAGSGKKVWWKCPKANDHVWQASGHNRIKYQGCPACTGRQASITNSLATLHPDLADQWHPTKNGDFTPETYVAGSHKKMWWKCSKADDHVWQAPGSNRINGRDCPACAGLQVSITNSLATLHPDLAAQWHPTKNGELSPKTYVAGSNKKVWWKCPKADDHVWQAPGSNRMRGVGCPACAGKQASVTNSLASLYPDLAVQWHPTKNEDFSPETYVAGSNKKVWWKCPKADDHIWEESGISRTRKKETTCPFCLELSRNTILTISHPELATQWHPTKNDDLTPDEYLANSTQKVWWKCHEGKDHVWLASGRSRINNSHCPFCTNQWK